MNSERARTSLFAIFGIGLALSISVAEIAMVLLLLDAAIRRGRDGAPRRSPLQSAILIFFVWGLITAFIGRSVSFVDAVRAQDAFVLFLLAVNCWSVDDNDRWIRWFLIGSAVAGAIAILQVSLHVDRYPLQDQLVVPPWLQRVPDKLLRAVAMRNMRAVGTRGHPLTYSEGLLAGFVLLLAGVGTPISRTTRSRWIAVVLVAAGLLFSQSRGVWLGVIAAGAVFAWYGRHRRDVRLAVIAGAAAAALALGVVPSIRQRAVSIVSDSGGQAADRASRDTRFQIWSAAWESIQNHPVAGVGVKGVQLTVNDPLLGTPRLWSETHDIFLQVTAERGVVGLGLFLWIVALVFLVSIRSSHPWREAGVAFLLAFLVAGLTESWTNDKEIALIFFAVVGALERRRLDGPPTFSL